MPRTALPIDQIFWRRVPNQPADGCWEWAGYIRRNGYGYLSRAGIEYGAHRVSYELHHGPIPPGRDVVVCHHCDNPICVRPDHLYLGTHETNAKDASERGFLTGNPLPGSQRPNAKLDEEKVIEIRRRWAEGEHQVDLAAEFGVTQGRISSVVTRKTWSHVL